MKKKNIEIIIEIDVKNKTLHDNNKQDRFGCCIQLTVCSS